MPEGTQRAEAGQAGIPISQLPVSMHLWPLAPPIPAARSPPLPSFSCQDHQLCKSSTLGLPHPLLVGVLARCSAF